MYRNETGLPSVTTIISPWMDKTWFKQEHCHRGDQAHERVRCDVTGEFMMDWEDEFYPYYHSYLKFKPRIKKVLLVEERLVDHDLGFCGQPDLVHVDQDDLVSMTDWKTCVAIYKYWPLQIGGYSILLKKHKNIICDKGMIVRLRKELDKDPLVKVYSIDECERLFYNQLELFNLMGGIKNGIFRNYKSN